MTKETYYAGNESFHATRRQLSLALAWVVTIHKCQGLTLPEIVVDMLLFRKLYKLKWSEK